MKVFSLFVCFVSFATLVSAADQIPTLVDGTVSVLTSNDATPQATTAAPALTAAASCGSCCETSKEVRLGPWQSRRLARQADRQEARDCRDCCKCEGGCCEKKDCRPKALVSVRTRCCCN